MGNYNPRQITQMRWRDVKELEQFTFVRGDYDFENEVIEEASKNSPWNKLVNKIKNLDSSKTNNDGGIILYDGPSAQVLYIGFVTNLGISLYSPSRTDLYVVDLEYDKDTDKLTIKSTNDEFVFADELKTIFNQSLLETGNITLFRHQITMTMGSQDFILFEYISANNLKVDSIQDLRTLCGNNFSIACSGVHQLGQNEFCNVVRLVGTATTLDYTAIKTDGSLLTSSALSSSLNDVVTTL